MRTTLIRGHSVLFVAIGVTILLATGLIVATNHSHKTATLTSTPRSTNATNHVTTPATPSSSTTANTVTSNPSSTSSPPQSPSGDFVSSYRVSANGQEQSTCNTTAGASCVITFTMGTTSESLPATQTTTSAKNPQGAYAAWTWEPSTIGLTPGNWNVAATASLNGESTTTKSSVQLVVTP
jgi:hypothetical protein